MKFKFFVALSLWIILPIIIFVQFPATLTFAKDKANLLTAFAMLISVLVALYFGEWKEKLEKPILSFSFNMEEEPFMRKLSLGRYKPILRYGGYPVDIVKPGFNVRVKIENNGYMTAKNVQARILKIEFYKNLW